MYKGIKIEMIKHDLNMEKLAKVLNISTASVSNKMSKKTQWKLAEAKKLVDFFNSKGSDLTVESLFFSEKSDIS